MTPALTEILFEIGAGGRVVGVTDYCDFPLEARSRNRIGGYANPSAEAILALEPDLVLVTPAAGNRDAALAVRRAGVRLEVIEADDLAGTYLAIEDTARLCGLEARGREIVERLRRRIAATKQRVAGLSRPRGLFCLQTDPLIAAGPGTLPAELFGIAGAENVVRAGRYPQIGLEAVVEAAPEVIVHALMDIPNSGARAPATILDFWRRWVAIPAVRDGRVVVIDATTALRPGPRVAEAVETLAELLHPELAGATDR